MAYRCLNDANWTMEFISKGCLELTGYEPSDMIGNRIRAYNALIHSDDREVVWNQVQEALVDNRPFRLVYRILHASGKEKWVWEQGLGIFSEGGRLLALEGFITDITEHQRAEEALVKANDKLYRLSKHLEEKVRERAKTLEEKNRKLMYAERAAELGKIANRVAHELRNPLTVVGGFAHRMYKNAPDDDPHKKQLRIIVDAVMDLEDKVSEIIKIRDREH